ncbi:hypothetical protein ACGRHY_26460 [Streptomyces sp. HK10]|uniref:hypothetical protein n=1 Tax=Streptomyces sp. HK10 TaxID=3373255 RepID=UPI003749D4AE
MPDTATSCRSASPPLPGRNPYWELVERLPWESDGDGSPPQPYARDRRTHCAHYSWAIPTPSTLRWIRQAVSRPVLEVGAGGGYWARQLQQLGMDVLPTDAVARIGGWTPVRLCDAEQAAATHPNRTLMLCWPPSVNEMAARALTAYRGPEVLYIGEPAGNSCATDAFFTTLDRQWTPVAHPTGHINWWGTHDTVTLYHRRPSPRPEAR